MGSAYDVSLLDLARVLKKTLHQNIKKRDIDRAESLIVALYMTRLRAQHYTFTLEDGILVSFLPLQSVLVYPSVDSEDEDCHSQDKQLMHGQVDHEAMIL